MAVRLNITEPGRRLPANFPESGQAYAGITPEEYKALVSRGVWAESGAGNWTREAPDGTVWAGGEAGHIAQVRGKRGRRLGGGRFEVPEHERRRTTSVQLSAVAKANLERIAAERTRRTGRKVTISQVLDTAARLMVV